MNHPECEKRAAKREDKDGVESARVAASAGEAGYTTREEAARQVSGDTVDRITAQLGVPRLVVDITPGDIETQATSGARVGFVDALESAIRSLIEDDNLAGSPLYQVEELPDTYDLPSAVDAAVASDKVRELLNESGCRLVLFAGADALEDQWVGKVLCEELDRAFDVASYWVFELVDSPFDDLNYAVVDRAGAEPTVNWGSG